MNVRGHGHNRNPYPQEEPRGGGRDGGGKNELASGLCVSGLPQDDFLQDGQRGPHSHVRRRHKIQMGEEGRFGCGSSGWSRKGAGAKAPALRNELVLHPEDERPAITATNNLAVLQGDSHPKDRMITRLSGIRSHVQAPLEYRSPLSLDGTNSPCISKGC